MLILFYKFINKMRPFLCHLTTYVLMAIIILYMKKKLGALQVQRREHIISFEFCKELEEHDDLEGARACSCLK